MCSMQFQFADPFFIDISGDALHASLGLPPAITVSMAKSGKLEIAVCYNLSNYCVSVLYVNAS